MGRRSLPHKPEKAADPGAGRGQRCAVSIFVRHHHGDGGLCVVDVERAAARNQLHEARGAIVVADVKRKRKAVGSGPRSPDGKAKHPDNIPEPSGFVLARHAGRNGNVIVEHAPGEKDGERDAGFTGKLRDFNLEAIGDGLRARVAVDDGAEWLGVVVVVGVHGLNG